MLTLLTLLNFLTFLRLTLSVEFFYSIRKRWWNGRIRKDDDDDASLLLCRRLYPHSTWAYQVSGISTFVLNVSHHLPRSTQPLYFSSQWWLHGFWWHGMQTSKTAFKMFRLSLFYPHFVVNCKFWNNRGGSNKYKCKYKNKCDCLGLEVFLLQMHLR